MTSEDTIPGKVTRREAEEIILSQLGCRRDEVLVGPRHGVDVGVVSLGNGQVMVVTTDPVFVLPELGWDRAAWFAIHIIASDTATSGLPPQYMCIDLNLPLTMTRADLADFWHAVHNTCSELGIAIVTGHTGRYEGCAFPIIGGATMIATGPEEQYVVPTMAAPGDAVVITKGAAIETAGMFAVCHSDKIATAYGAAFAKDAESIFYQMSTVQDSLTAVEVGVRENGITAMHDATERGVVGALVEIAQASGSGLVVDKETIPVPEAVEKICRLFGVDPYASSSEGTLMLACKQHKVGELHDRLNDVGILSAQIGELTDVARGIRWTVGGHEEEMKEPDHDPFWPAFRKAHQSVEEG